jgi:hypothetical protein
MTEDRLFKTEDMALVTTLKLRGIEPEEMVRSGQGVSWIFLRDETANDVVDEYAMGEAYVEPQEFVRKLGLVRSEMYRFLDIRPRRVR